MTQPFMILERYKAGLPDVDQGDSRRIVAPFTEEPVFQSHPLVGARLTGEIQVTAGAGGDQGSVQALLIDDVFNPPTHLGMAGGQQHPNVGAIGI